MRLVVYVPCVKPATLGDSTTFRVAGEDGLAEPLDRLSVAHVTNGLKRAVKDTVPLIELTTNCCAAGSFVPTCHGTGAGANGVMVREEAGETTSVTLIVAESLELLLRAVMEPVWVPAAKPEGSTCTRKVSKPLTPAPALRWIQSMSPTWT